MPTPGAMGAKPSIIGSCCACARPKPVTTSITAKTIEIAFFNIYFPPFLKISDKIQIQKTIYTQSNQLFVLGSITSFSLVFGKGTDIKKFILRY
jgi:hypothetical protein